MKLKPNILKEKVVKKAQKKPIPREEYIVVKYPDQK